MLANARNLLAVVVVVVLVMAAFGTAVQAAETVLFHDSIGGYEKYNYSDQNAAVVFTQGGSPNHNPLISSWTYGGTAGSGQDYNVTPPDQFCFLNSGGIRDYSTIAVPLATPSTTRYGQVVATIGASRNWLVRLAVSSDTTPTFVDATFPNPHTNSDLGPDFGWFVNGENRYWSDDDNDGDGDSHTITGYRTYEFQKITINYDLLLDKYSVYINDSLVVNNVNFAHKLDTVSSIAIGGAYWSPGHGGAMDLWLWRVRDTAAYTGPGLDYIPPTGTVIAIQ